MYRIWSMLNNLNYVMYILKCNIFIPPQTNVFFVNIKDLLSLNSNFTDKAFDYIEDQVHLDSIKKQMGFLKNLSVFFFIALALAVLIINILLLILLSQNCPKFRHFIDKIRNIIFFNPILRFSLQSYLKFCEVSFLYFYDPMAIIDEEDSDKTTTTLATSIVILLYITFLPIFILFFLRVNHQKLKLEEFNSRYGSLYLSIDRSQKNSIFLNVIFLIRRLGLVITVTFLRNTPSFQMIYLWLTSIATIIYLIKVQPMEDQSLNNFEMVSESCVLLCTIVLSSFTDYNTE